jgi:DNA helicase-2/ATP-dependent DNA helicase PcrA
MCVCVCVQALALDLLAYISLAVKHDEDKAFERVLNKPKRGLAEQALQKLRHAQQRLKCSLFEVAKKLMRPEYKALSAAQQKSLASFVSVISELRKDVSTKTPEEVLKAVVPRVYQNQGARAAGAAGKKQDTKDKEEDNFERTKLIKAFLEDLAVTEGLDDDIGTNPAAGGAPDPGQTARKLSKFVSTVRRLDTEGLKKMRESEVLSLGTIHAAKGLEFSHVWLVQMAEGICPQGHNVDGCEDEEQAEAQRNAAVQEERRIAYVALTRAKEQLCISWTATDHSGQQMEPSRFIEEIPEEFKEGPKEAAAARVAKSAAFLDMQPSGMHVLVVRSRSFSTSM